MTKVTVCADDFGLTCGVSSGILACLERRRISATSLAAKEDQLRGATSIPPNVSPR
jgi:predicted glycoside hydrolase/deacetylase ChbG (UPF0249 family)